MKKCDRCGHIGKGHFHSVEGKALCEDCYSAWIWLLQRVFLQFLGEKLRIEEAPQYEKII